ncbi:MAG: peptidase U32 family protein [Eubacterium sp.]
MKVELLAPGGSFDSVIAAYNAGADAVYTGGEMFGARAGADNLTTEQLIEALNYAHIHNKKLYLTINTLLKDREIENQLYDFIAPLYENGLDAVIVQDMGVLKYIRDHFEKLNIHASTQMTIFGSETAEELKKMGVTRIVTPRELSICEIKEIHETSSIEIESFVHGALCYCYSGQCFLSSYIGGRSGNRGRCAQPCRMEYDVIYHNQIMNPGNNKYVLSPKDICTLKILPQIIEAGVYSLKIEGRMKKLEYIAGVTSIYRKYIDLYLENPDKYKVEQKDIELLGDLFNRNGFHESYYNQHNGRNMISLKKPDFRKENREFNQYLKNTFSGKILKKDIDVEISCLKETPFEISTVVDGNKVTVKGDIPGAAINKPIEETTIEKQIRKTGNTDFSIKNVNIIMDQDLFLPMGAINELRRRFLDKVTEAVLAKYHRTAGLKKMVYHTDIQTQCSKSAQKSKKMMISVDVWNYGQFQEALKYDFVERIYLECSGLCKEHILKAISQGKFAGKHIYLAMPYVFRKKDKDYFDKKCLDYVKYTEGILIRNPEQYYHLKNLKVVNNYIFDYNVYADNIISKKYYSDNGQNKTTVPLELNYRELEKRGCSGDEMIVYGYMPAMISAGCCLKTCNSCTGNDAVYKIKDRMNNYFPVRCICEYCYNIMYNCKPLSLFKFKDEINGLNPDSVRLAFTFENQEEMKTILKRARQAFIEGAEVRENNKSTRGHFKRGVL